MCYAWGRDLAGPWTGVLSASLWCFSPNVLAHAQLCTPDAHATAMGAAACYTFWRWLQAPTWTQAIVTGCVLGAAELAKTTLIIFYPIWPLLWIGYRVLEPAEQRANRAPGWWVRELGMLAARMAIGIYVLNFGYGFEGSFSPLRSYEFVSRLFAEDPSRNIPTTSTPPGDDQANDRPRGNRFGNGWLAQLPVPLPKHYIVGIDLQQRDFEAYGQRSYLAGTFRERGWWYYYLYVLGVKTSLGMWLLAGLASVCAVGFLRQRTRIPGRDQPMLLVVPATIFVVVSSKTGFSEHGRYILPCVPLVLVWIAATIGTAIRTSQTKTAHVTAIVGTFIGLCWTLGSVASVFPHTLSYFNAIAGGPRGGPRHLLHSNIDWGQDLLFLKRWMDNHPTVQPLHVAVFAGLDPAAIGFSDVQTVTTKRTRPDGPEMLPAGWYAVSVNLLYGYDLFGRDGMAQPHVHSGTLTSLRTLEPTDRAGYSIYIYHLPTDLPVDAAPSG